MSYNWLAVRKPGLVVFSPQLNLFNLVAGGEINNPLYSFLALTGRRIEGYR